MSFVGPRPERPEIAKQYEEEMPEFGLRLQAKAGLTGYRKWAKKPTIKLLYQKYIWGNRQKVEQLVLLAEKIILLVLLSSFCLLMHIPLYEDNKKMRCLL